MHEIRIERVFGAAHALRLYDGSMEASHRHDWRTFVHVQAEELDDIELVMDFHELERIVGGVLGDLDGHDLNQHPAFAKVNPSAERVAEHIYQMIAAQLPAGRVELAKVTVTEAPGCRASYRR